MSQLNPKSKSNRTAFFSVVISISLVLFLFGLLGLVFINAHKLSNYVKEKIAVSVFLMPEIPEPDILRFKKKLEAKPYVRKTIYIPKEKAAEMLSEDLGDDFVQFLGFNPLQSSLDIYLHSAYLHQDSLQRITQNIENKEIVKEVFFQEDLLGMVNQNVRKIGLVIIVFLLLLLVVSMVLIGNSVRLSIYAKRLLIRTMQLVGATPGFIQKPFLKKGILQGFLGGLIAVLMLGVLVYYFSRMYPEIFVEKDLDLTIFFFVFLILFGMFISFVTTYFSVRKYIRIQQDKLY